MVSQGPTEEKGQNKGKIRDENEKRIDKRNEAIMKEGRERREDG